MFNLITVGDAVVDTQIVIGDAEVECRLDSHNCKLCMDYASKIPITDSFQTIGGNAANVAAGASALGLQTAIISAVGNDANGQLITSELAKQNIDTSLITIDAKSKTRYSMIINYQGERTILSYHAPRKYVWPKEIPATDWIYYTSLSEGFEDLQKKLLAHIAKHPTIRLAMNPGSFQLKNALDTTMEAIKKTDILIVNLEEAERITNDTLESEKSVSSLIHQILELGTKEVVITDGSNGAWVGTEEEIYQIGTFPVKVVAKTGAGDAFSSGYLSARFYGNDIPESLRWGIANSSSVIEQYGSQKGLLNKNGIKKMMGKYSDIKARRD